VHVCAKPHCEFSVHEMLPLPTSASAETWKSLKTTRPHWLADVAVIGALKVKCGT
jgi:hypothetical protein